MKLVKITWVDSYGVGQDWKLTSDIKDEQHKCISVGYLAGDGDNVKVIVPHLSPANEAIDSEERGCGDIAIPVSAILSIVELIERPISTGL